MIICFLLEFYFVNAITPSSALLAGTLDCKDKERLCVESATTATAVTEEGDEMALRRLLRGLNHSQLVSSSLMIMIGLHIVSHPHENGE